jgi:ketosteroid isomerase-like protein
MAEENVEIVRRVFDAAARRDTAALLSLYDPQVEWDGSRHRWAEVLGETMSRFHGHEGLRKWARQYYEMWENYEDDLEQLIAAGEQVVSVVTTRARGRASGVAVEWKHNAGVWTVRDGKIVRVIWFATVADALEAAGLPASEPSAGT